MELAVGLELRQGQYRLTELLGEGGMASVWAAEHRLPDGRVDEVVLKILLPEFRRIESKREMFLEEARLAQGLSHPNIVSIYDVDQYEDMDFLVMERIWGKDLETVVRRAKEQQKELPWEIAVQLVLPVARALQYANSRQDAEGNTLTLVHRDIKPANLLFECTGNVKIIDFGVAKASNSDLRTQTGLVKGTIAYMSPEQLRAEPLDIRSDLFSLGVVLYELLTTRRPFWGDTFTALMLGILTREPPQITSLRKDLPPALVEFVHRCLDKDSAPRPADGDVFADELEEILATLERPTPLKVFFLQCFPEFMDALEQRQLYADTNVVDASILLPSGKRDEASDRSQNKDKVRPVGVGENRSRAPFSAAEDPLQSSATVVEISTASLETFSPRGNAHSSGLQRLLRNGVLSGIVLLAAIGVFFLGKQKSRTDKPDSIVVIVPARPTAPTGGGALPPRKAPLRPVTPPRTPARRSSAPVRKTTKPALRRSPPKKRAQRVALAKRPEPAPRPARKRGTLRVIMTPRCKLYRSGRFLGWTPKTLRGLREGVIKLRCVNKKKFFQRRFYARIRAGKVTSYRREIKQGSLVVFANSWGRVVVKGLGKLGTTQQVKKLYAGRYTILVFQNNRQRFKIRKVRIRPGKRTVLKIKWKR